MRAGGCTVQQTLTADAAVMVKQAVSLARRRGNGQVTPLHVASAMLQAPPPSGLLRAACLRSHSHPLQCKALELCFNVALNRLPASAGASPLFGHQYHGQGYYPSSLSNALVAAFKRAQAHQRRGSVDTQQQPVLAVKIELEQLVISILDDPSVSRVMREAGFSSPQVKANVEQAVSSMEGNNPCTATPAADAHGRNPKPNAAASSLPLPPHQEANARKLPLDQVREEDVAAILDCLATQSKRRVMVVAESASVAEAAARAAVDKIKRGEAASQEALRGAQVVSLKMSMFQDLPRVEAERRLAELRCVVKAAGGAVVLVVEDLMWAAEFWVVRVEAGRRLASGCYYYCGVEHAVAEVRALACRGDGVWLVGYGTYQAYMRCRIGHPSLESLWGIQTLAVPAGSLALSLNCVDVDSEVALNHRRSMKAECDVSGNGSTLPACLSLLDGGGSGQLTAASTCCADCTATEAGAVKALHRSIVPSSSSIPSWLQHCRDQEPPHCKKWSSACGGSPSHRTTLNKDFSTVVSPSSSVTSHEQYYCQQLYQPWLLAEAHEPKHPGRAQCGDEAADGVRLLSATARSRDSSASYSSVEVECRSRFKELSAENLKVLCAALEKEVPLQKEIVPEIASTVLRCRSGTAKRRNVDGNGAKEETWMLFLGGDTDVKARVARELASLVFGSRRSFVFIDVNTLSPARSDSTEQHRAAKRPRSEASRGYLERLFEAVRDNPHRVILMDGVDQVDRRCQMAIKEAVESGVVRSHVGDEVSLGDAIVVLSCESFGSRSRACSPPPTNNANAISQEDSTSGHRQNEAVATSSTWSCFDLNMSVDDVDEFEEECCFGDAVLLKAVDRTLFFRPPENL
ncbi:hypothetical protein ACQ4PT_014569 [Festuca glaucescens]